MSSFSLSEIFRMAEEIERNGYAFYSQAITTVKDDQCKQVFTTLAEQEKAHEALFSRWRKDICGTEDSTMTDLDDQAAAYIHSVADNHVFNLNKETSDLLTSIQTPMSLLDMAIGFEEDTIKFFESLKGHVSDNTRHGLEILISEEHRHVKILTDLKRDISSQH